MSFTAVMTIMQNWNLTIVEPSNTQYCTLRHEYVKKDNICKDYRFDETRISFWEYVEKELKKGG